LDHGDKPKSNLDHKDQRQAQELRKRGARWLLESRTEQAILDRATTLIAPPSLLHPHEGHCTLDTPNPRREAQDRKRTRFCQSIQPYERMLPLLMFLYLNQNRIGESKQGLSSGKCGGATSVPRVINRLQLNASESLIRQSRIAAKADPVW